MQQKQPLLELQNITKEFGSIRALKDVSFSISPGEILGLMGDNGAGKSTISKIMAGNFMPTTGAIKVEGKIVSLVSPLKARQTGIEMVYQDLALADNLTAAENVFLGRELVRYCGPFKILDHKTMSQKSLEIFTELKSETRPDDPVRMMSGGQRQAVAIARTRLAKAKLVIMDEPTAAISVRQVTEVLDLIKRLKKSGTSIILISHRMPDIFEVCDRVVVLRRGYKRADKRIEDTSPEEVTALITGALDKA